MPFFQPHQHSAFLQENPDPCTLQPGPSLSGGGQDDHSTTRRQNPNRLPQFPLLHLPGEEDRPEGAGEEGEARPGDHPAHPLLFRAGSEGWIHPHHLHPTDSAGHRPRMPGGRPLQQEGARPFRDPEEGSEAQGLLFPGGFRIDGRGRFPTPSPPGQIREGLPWRGPEVAETVLDGEGVTAIRTPEIALDDPAVTNLLGQEDEPEARPAAGTGEPVSEEEVHALPPHTPPGESASGYAGAMPYWAHCPGLSDSRA
jgi:hypothetical protein